MPNEGLVPKYVTRSIPDSEVEKRDQLVMFGMIHLMKSILANPNGVELGIEDFLMFDGLPDTEEFTISANTTRTAFSITHCPKSVQ